MPITISFLDFRINIKVIIHKRKNINIVIPSVIVEFKIGDIVDVKLFVQF